MTTALWDGDRRLHAFAVMPNHVHLLVTPHVVATRWLRPLKGFTAYQANAWLGRHGQTFWQDESYDSRAVCVVERGWPTESRLQPEKAAPLFDIVVLIVMTQQD